MSPWWLLVPTTLAMLAAWSCWCESRRGDRYQRWMIAESIRADKAESRAAWRMLTSAERDAVQWAESAAANARHPAESVLRSLRERLGGGG